MNRSLLFSRGGRWWKRACGLFHSSIAVQQREEHALQKKLGSDCCVLMWVGGPVPHWEIRRENNVQVTTGRGEPATSSHNMFYFNVSSQWRERGEGVRREFWGSRHEAAFRMRCWWMRE